MHANHGSEKHMQQRIMGKQAGCWCRWDISVTGFPALIFLIPLEALMCLSYQMGIKSYLNCSLSWFKMDFNYLNNLGAVWRRYFQAKAFLISNSDIWFQATQNDSLVLCCQQIGIILKIVLHLKSKTKKKKKKIETKLKSTTVCNMNKLFLTFWTIRSNTYRIKLFKFGFLMLISLHKEKETWRFSDMLDQKDTPKEKSDGAELCCMAVHWLSAMWADPFLSQIHSTHI